VDEPPPGGLIRLVVDKVTVTAQRGCHVILRRSAWSPPEDRAGWAFLLAFSACEIDRDKPGALDSAPVANPLESIGALTREQSVEFRRTRSRGHRCRFEEGLTLVVWIALIAAMPIAAWGMWLLFCYGLARMHGIEALKAAPSVAKAFPIAAWVSSLRYVGPWVVQVFGRSDERRLPPS